MCNLTKIGLRVHKRLHSFASIFLIICSMLVIFNLLDSAFFCKLNEGLSFFIQYTAVKFCLSAHKSLNISGMLFYENWVTHSQTVAFICLYFSQYLFYAVHF